MRKLETRLVLFHSLGAEIGPLPDVIESAITVSLSGLPVLTITYPVQGLNAKYLIDECEIGFQIKQRNGDWVEPTNARFVYQTHRTDHIERPGNYTTDFIGVGDHARYALVYDNYGKTVTKEGNVEFTFATPGEIVKFIFDNAVARGWSGLTYTFTNTHDSAGQPWDSFVKLSLAMNDNLLDTIETMQTQGLADVVWSGRTLYMYKVDTVYNRDLTSSNPPVKFFHGEGQIAAPDYQSTVDKMTHAIVMGDDGKRWVFGNGTTAASGRREVTLSQGGVEDEATAQKLAASYLERGKKASVNRTREFKLENDETALPFEDFRQGDWVYSQHGLEFETLRIVSFSLTTTHNGQRGHVVLGEPLPDFDKSVAKRLATLTDGKPQTPQKPTNGVDPRIPNRPTLAGAVTSSYYDANGNLQGVVELTVLHDGKASNGANAGKLTYWLESRPTGSTDTWSRVAKTEEQF